MINHGLGACEVTRWETDNDLEIYNPMPLEIGTCQKHVGPIPECMAASYRDRTKTLHTFSIHDVDQGKCYHKGDALVLPPGSVRLSLRRVGWLEEFTQPRIPKKLSSAEETALNLICRVTRNKGDRIATLKRRVLTEVLSLRTCDFKAPEAGWFRALPDELQGGFVSFTLLEKLLAISTTIICGIKWFYTAKRSWPQENRERYPWIKVVS